MSLFLKIFLWFWLAMALIAGVLFFVSWSTQNEPIMNRVRINFTNQLNIYTAIAKQIHDEEGEAGAREFLQKLKISDQIKDACLVHQNETASCFQNGSNEKVREIIGRAFESENVEINLINPEENYAAKGFTVANGEKLVLVLQIKFLPLPPPLGENWEKRILRILTVILTAGLVCYALTRYLISPVLKLRDATQKLAGGDLSARIETKRRDELGRLAEDFNVMAERLESLIGSQKRLTRDVSHELRSPLARMNVALELAKQKSNPEIKSLLDRIETENARLNEMISQILTLSRLEARAEKIEKRDVNLKKLVEQIAADAEFEAAGRGKSVKILRADECRVFGNEVLLRSAVENVVRNAARYTKNGNPVEISLTNGDDKARVSIRDYGEGVPENELREMFEPFYRVAEARERKTGGIGLGLAITKQCVEAHHGKIAARNAADGGLIVDITLPVNSEKNARE
jgi:signal transduction histidine kinase